MALTPLERMGIKNAVERVLHVPGNYNGGRLEITMVFDGSLSADSVRQKGKDIGALLKSHSEVFRNVRLNTVLWMDDGAFQQESGSIPYLQMGRCFDNYYSVKKRKRLEPLMAYLKKFHARAKIIFLLTDGNYRVEDEVLLKDNMRPFLYRKLIVLKCGEIMQEERFSIL